MVHLRVAFLQVLQHDANKALHMIKKLAAEPDSEGTPKASKQALIPLDFFKRCKVHLSNFLAPFLLVQFQSSWTTDIRACRPFSFSQRPSYDLGEYAEALTSCRAFNL